MQIRYDTLKSYLDKRLDPLYILSGDEILLLQEAADMIRTTARTKNVGLREVMTVERGFNWTSLHMANGEQSLFGERKLIEIRIPSGTPGKEGSQILQKYITEINPDNITLIILPKLDRKTQKTAWVAALQKAGMYIEIPTIGLSDLKPWIENRLKKQHQTANKLCIDFLAERVEGNLLAANQEIQKLGLLYPEGELNFEQVRNSVLNVARYDIFQLNDAMLNENPARFIRILNGLKSEGTPVQLVHWIMTTEIRTLLLYKTAFENKESPFAIAKKLRLFAQREKLIKRMSEKLKKNDIQFALQQAAQIDKMIKGLRHEAIADNAWHALTDLGLSLMRH